MDLGRLRGTDWVVGALALALLGALFLPWYHGEVSGVLEAGQAPPDAPTYNAFEAYAATDVVLAAFAALAIGIVVLTATQSSPAVPVAWTALTALVSLVAVGFMVVAALTLPDERLAREVGPTIGLTLTVALAGAVWSTMRSERPGPAVARSSRSDVETLPAPGP